MRARSIDSSGDGDDGRDDDVPRGAIIICRPSFFTKHSTARTTRLRLVYSCCL
jgi:hypothetical protein